MQRKIQCLVWWSFIQQNLWLFSENSDTSSKRIVQPRIWSEGGMEILWTQVASVKGRVQAEWVQVQKQIIVFDRLTCDVQVS
jgi:hypothetical protein